MNSTNITYIFGAGASSHAVPTVKQFEDELKKFKKLGAEFIQLKSSFASQFRNDHDHSIQEFWKDIEWLMEEVVHHASIDTLARKLFLTNNREKLALLKLLVGEFIYFSERINGIDKRYDAFFATIINQNKSGELVLPKDFTLLTWNYDKQIERAFCQFVQKNSAITVDELLQVCPREGNGLDSANKIALMKLNGTYGSYINDEGQFINLFGKYPIERGIQEDNGKFGLISEIIKRYRQFKEGIQDNGLTNNSISYSWENGDYQNKIRKRALQRIFDTTVLVVIGYSFPTFNRYVDYDILWAMEKIEKVIIQAPAESLGGIENRMKALYDYDFEIQKIDSIDEFYIPYEFTFDSM